MWQYIAIAIIGAAVVIYLLDKLFPCLFRKKKPKKDNPCDNCRGCVLHPKNK